MHYNYFKIDFPPLDWSVYLEKGSGLGGFSSIQPDEPFPNFRASKSVDRGAPKVGKDSSDNAEKHG